MGCVCALACRLPETRNTGFGESPVCREAAYVGKELSSVTEAWGSSILVVEYSLPFLDEAR